MKIISLWSGPRNVSTALMYSFAQRPDTTVIDEPLYAHYLIQTGADHPGREEILSMMDNDGNNVINEILSHQGKKLLFLKNMGHHYLKLDDHFLDDFENIFLIRNPEEMLPSLSVQIPEPILRDTGLKKQVELYKQVEALGKKPLIIDSKHLLTNPKEILQQVCQRLAIDFYPDMLSWQAGARTEDGVWAEHWYHNVHMSTGFGRYSPKEAPFPNHLKPLLDECLPYYEFLYEKSLKI